MSTRRDEVHVSAAPDGVLAQWSVHEGGPVPLARPYPEVPA